MYELEKKYKGVPTRFCASTRCWNDRWHRAFEVSMPTATTFGTTQHGHEHAALVDAWNSREIKHTIVREIPDFIERAPVRLSVSEEYGVNDAATASFEDPLVQYRYRKLFAATKDDVMALRNEETDPYTRLFRYIDRRSFTTPHQTRIDISAVRTLSTDEDAPSPIGYEVEVEYVGDSAVVQDIEGRIALTMEEILPVLMGIDQANSDDRLVFPSLGQATAALDEFHGLRRRIEVRDQYVVPPVKDLRYVGGLAPVAGLQGGWRDRRMLARDGNLYVITAPRPATTVDTRPTRAAPPLPTEKPVYAERADHVESLGGELVTASDRRQYFLAFGVVYNGAPVVDLDLLTRMEKLQAMVELPGRLGKRARRPVCRAKTFQPIDADNLYDTRRWLACRDRRSGRGGGKVRDRRADPHGRREAVRRGRTRPEVRKWKPQGLTVDLCSMGCVRGDAGQSLARKASGAGRSPSSKRPAEGGRFRDGVVVEFRFDGDNIVPVRVRDDKSARVSGAFQKVRQAMQRESSADRKQRLAKASELGVPAEWIGLRRANGAWEFPDIAANNETTVRRTRECALNPLNLEVLSAFLQGTSYFGQRQSKHAGMQRAVRLNNDAKLVLLRSIIDNTQYVRKGQWLNVLDLACGEGNDLPRWKSIARHLKTYLGVDRDICAVVEARRRLAFVYTRAFRRSERGAAPRVHAGRSRAAGRCRGTSVRAGTRRATERVGYGRTVRSGSTS